ncbi:MAG: terpene cyclase/mutase family protein [Candidatus Nealsonbacteria bacterium]|nr:terpene cyclase/mutase family protein [Candidatus Nealsonbacteria bacterium]
MFDNDFAVSSCPDDASSTNYTLNAWCAVSQLVSSQGWTATSTWYPYGVMLNAINQYAGSDTDYWLWFGNSEPGETALNQHVLSEDEQLLLAFGTGPLKITASSLSPLVGSTTTLNVFYFDAVLWQWLPGGASNFLINGQVFSSSDGALQFLVAAADPYSVFGRKAGYIDSSTLTITGISQNSSGGRAPPPLNYPVLFPVSSSVNVEKAVEFLISNQNSDGSIGSADLYSDWAAMALAVFGESEARDKLKDYLTEADVGTEFRATDLERRAMALMALGVNPYNGGPSDYIERIISTFDGQQIGDPGLFNDDIFALFPLLKAGYSGQDQMVEAIVSFIISKQNYNGSWEGIDLTAAAIQALSLAQKEGNLNFDLADSVRRAKKFLRNAQEFNGGFGNNPISTSWVIQAIAALGERASDWKNYGNDPAGFLASYQNDDGGFGGKSATIDARIWETAYAVPAALNKSWDEIIGAFPKEIKGVRSDEVPVSAAVPKLPPVEAVVSLPEVKSEQVEDKTTESLIVAQVSANTVLSRDLSTNENKKKIIYLSAGVSLLAGLYFIKKFFN